MKKKLVCDANFYKIFTLSSMMQFVNTRWNRTDWKAALPVAKFIIALTLVFVSLNFFYSYIYLDHFKMLAPTGTDPFSQLVASNASFTLRIFGFDSEAGNASSAFGSFVSLNGKEVVIVIPDCSGAKNIFIILALLIAFPGPVKKKMWFIPLSILCFYVTNVIRVSLLAIVYNGSWRQFFYIIKPLATYISHTTLFFIFALWLKLLLKKL